MIQEVNYLHHSTRVKSYSNAVLKMQSADFGADITIASLNKMFIAHCQGCGLHKVDIPACDMCILQGALGLARLATTFFLKDELGLAPAELAALTGIFTLPWVLKPLYGFLSDGVPIFGYRRRSYMLLSGLTGAGAWAYLSLYAHTPAEATAACVLANLGVAVSDVVADSLVVEKARDSQSQAVSSGLQSLCWGSSAVGGIISAYFSGALLERMGTRDVFLITAALPLLVSFAALLVDEKPRPQVEASVQDQVSGQVVSLWRAITQKSVWLPALFIFLWQATPTSDSAFFYFLTNDIKVGPEFLGRVRLGSSIASLLGVWIFQTYLKEVRISTIMFWTSIVSVPLGFTQLLLIYHVNRQLGIPDEVFTFGDDVILTVLGQIAFMPTLVLAARLCPPGVEGTLFALLMSIFNGGGIVGSELGAALTKSIGVTETDFTNLGKLVLLCNLSSLLPLPFLKWIEEDEDRVARETKQQKGKRWWLAKKEPAKDAPPP
eukprot:TRINITY_DN954_c0_g1_i2.p1 TRINITY_DN954_c0_g1~~TRINITY_DN954_c0_g1_i2.p1  ORF type:complete len:492 (+),score=68.81 TRINITY_DN954_c0_g1_i2:1589-3064(+)